MAFYLATIIEEVERRLAAFYGFAPMSSATAHLVTREELKTSLGEGVAELPEYHARGGVFLVDSGENADIFIGIHLEDEVRQALERQDPLSHLGDENLDPFCVLIEEISHFHLILNRASSGQGVSKLELEWQGEIDKLLVSALTLRDQYGQAPVTPLARKLYDQAVITAAAHELYWEATRHAARFWYHASRQAEPLGPRQQELLRKSYRSSWAEKLTALSMAKVS